MEKTPPSSVFYDFIMMRDSNPSVLVYSLPNEPSPQVLRACHQFCLRSVGSPKQLFFPNDKAFHVGPTRLAAFDKLFIAFSYSKHIRVSDGLHASKRNQVMF